jgi:hypothetical protein
LLLGFCRISSVCAQESSPKILFLRLKLESNQVSLISTSVTPGRMKGFSAERPALDVEVATSTGQVLWTNNLPHPSIRRLEYEDPEHPGHLISKEVELTNTEFSVRVPVFKEAYRVNFYLPPSPAPNAPLANALVTNLPPVRKLVGTIALPSEAK